MANKLSDVLPKDKNDIEKYQDYHPVDRNVVVRRLCSDTINAICVFSNTATIQNVGAILYHEIEHLMDYYDSWFKEDCYPNLSNNREFIEVYKYK